MFQFLFKYPWVLFAKGKFVLLAPWPTWALVVAIVVTIALPGIWLWRRRERLRRSVNRTRAATLWMLQAGTLALLLLLLWQPAISVTALRNQQNIIAVVVDDSRSMGEKDAQGTREQQALQILNAQLLPALNKRFQVRLYRVDAALTRAAKLQELTAAGSATRIGAGLQQLAEEAATLPIGAIVLLTDGADSSGGVSLDVLNDLRRRRLPVHTVGFGREQLAHDVELSGFEAPRRALADSRVEAVITIRQNSFEGRRAHLVITADGSPVSTRDVVLTGDLQQREAVEFNAGKAGVRRLEARLDVLPGENNVDNNRRTAILSVDGGQRRILYIEGEPRWEYKFIRRAVDDDAVIHVVSMLRTTQNKIYRQGVAGANELADGFPTKAEDLFGYQGLIVGSVESGFFTPAQQQAIQEFADRRGGGVLFLGGRAGLADGEYNAAPFAQLLPVMLPGHKNTFARQFVAAELTEQGKKSLICRIEDNREDSANHWNVLPYLADYEDAGSAKPGAVVLAQVNAGGKRLPLLVTENYGRGRTAVFATGGSWRWRMQQPVADTSQETFWRQLLRWTAGASPTPVVSSAEPTRSEDSGAIKLRAEVRNKQYNLVSDADVTADVIGPDGNSRAVNLHAAATNPGVYEAEFAAEQSGAYVAEVRGKQRNEELGRDVVTFQREDGVAENFHREQNRELLERLSEETGGRYYTARDAGRLPDEISYSESGLTAREDMDLWNMPIVFLVLLALRSGEWLFRRKWGVV